MKRLRELYDIDSDVEIKGISINSKEINEGDIFVCTKGVSADRHEFIDEAISNGASAVVVSKDIEEKSVPIIKVDDTNKELPLLCQRLYDYPEKDLKLIAVTGTDGKTTIAEIIQTLLGSDCAYIGTNGATYKDFHEHLINTTPDSHLLYRFFDIFRSKGAKYVSMEASSESFYRKRLTTLDFDITIYSNISHEHLNIHKTFDNYLECKIQLVKQTKKDGFAIINSDDKYSENFKKEATGTVLTYGKNDTDTIQIVDYTLSKDKTLITFKYNNETFDVESPLLAEYNIYNLACGILACLKLGKTLDEILPNIKNIKVEGRMDVIDTKDDYMVIVDFAHTPHAIEAILKYANELDHNKIITVIGSAGGRDKEKRPIIGDICSKYSDYIYLTTDDPRDEDPKEICEMMAKNIDKSKYEIILDRSKAVETAILNSKEKDIVLLLCKGNEPYQITDKGYIPYNEKEEAQKAINKKLEA